MVVRMNGAVSVSLVLILTASISGAQTPAPARAPAPGAATLVPNAEIEAALRATDAVAIADKVLRVLPIGGEYNVGVSVVRRAKIQGKTPPEGIEHHAITEIYHVLDTPHGFSEILSDQITYLLVRVDPHRVLSGHEGKP